MPSRNQWHVHISTARFGHGTRVRSEACGIFGLDRSQEARYSLVCELSPFVVNFMSVKWRRKPKMSTKADRQDQSINDAQFSSMEVRSASGPSEVIEWRGRICFRF
jgi:hypothetical protein